jgi:SAM-dependent methyltransferase
VHGLGDARRVLEIGCGGGWMLGALREQGRWVVGTERSLEAARPARENGSLVFVGDLTALSPRASFDVIVLFHVLEHLEDPRAALAACAAHLAAGGRIVVGVPNRASWQARAFGSAWFHLDVPRHVVHFSPRSLDRAFAAVGLRRVRTSYVSPEHDPYGWLQSALDRLGFPQGALTHRMMGMGGGSPLLFLAMAVVSAPILAVGTLL